jgi:Mg2+ and Co2+ transporter CorA
MGRKFELRTDHSGLKYLFEQPTLNSRQTKWLNFLNEYDFDIKNIKGKENKVVDALSRRVHKMHDTTISMYMIDLKDRILEVVTTDQHYVQVKESLQQNILQQKYKDCKLEEDGILLFNNKVYFPISQELRNSVLKEMHNVSYVGHPGY